MGGRVYRAPGDRKPWERQDGEGPKAWEAFQTFRDMGLERTLPRVCEALGKSRGTIAKWSMDNRWSERAEAWDREQDRQIQKAQMAAIRKMRRDHADLGASMLIKAAKALKRLPEDEIKAVDISRMVEVGSKLERIARGDVGEVVEEREGESLPPVTFYIPRNHRDDEGGTNDA